MARIPSPRNSSPSPSLRSWTSRANDRSAIKTSEPVHSLKGKPAAPSTYETFHLVLQRPPAPAEQLIGRRRARQNSAPMATDAATDIAQQIAAPMPENEPAHLLVLGLF